MIDLPRDLAPWRPLLSIFAPDVAESVGAMIPRIALAVGPMRAARPAGEGEPDGLAGLARRGSYERLLLSEWLLAEEAPLEFIRRAASGEHAFLQVVRRSPARARTSVALFDAGPDQIGAPRIAHVAALVVLAARAERAGARFAWGILHRPADRMFTEVTRETVAPLINARSAIGPTEEDLAAWGARAASSGWEDAWVVGGLGITPDRRFGTVAVADVIDPDRRALTLIARAPGAAPREVELPLPEERACARLLRAPFSAAPAPAAVIRRCAAAAPASNLIFASSGAKVFARGEGGEVFAYPVPNSANDAVGRVKRYVPRSGERVAAAGWVMRGLATLAIGEREIRLEHATTRGPAILRAAIPIPEGTSPARAGAFDPISPLVYSPGDPDRVYFADAARRLFVIEQRRDGAASVRLVAGEVSLFIPAGDRAAYVGRLLGSDDPIVASRDVDGGFHLVSEVWSESAFGIALEGDGTFEAVAGYSMTALGLSALVGVQTRGDRWAIYEDGHAIDDQRVSDDLRVVGVMRERMQSPSILALEPDHRILAILDGSPVTRLPRAAAPIADVTVSTRRPILAYLTTAGEVVIVSLPEGTVLARFLP